MYSVKLKLLTFKTVNHVLCMVFDLFYTIFEKQN